MNHTTKVIQTILNSPNIDQSDILYALNLAGATVSQIANECDCSLEIVYQVIRGQRRSFDIATFIAVTLNTTTRKLWGSAYDYTPRRPANQERVAAHG